MTELSFTGRLLTGVAWHLHNAGVGVYSPDAPADLQDVAITLITLPQAPQLVVCITDYPVDAAPGVTEGIVGINVRLRGDENPLTVLGMYDQVYDALHGLRGVVGSGDDQVGISQMWWQSGASLGPAEGGQLQRSVNFYAQLDRAGLDTD